jgi:peptidoglycan/xylan/chitin deacetylase (PgdA/CDA1 family)
MNKFIKNIALETAHRSGILRGSHRFDDSSGNALYVLVYHRVDWPDSQPHLDPHNLSATPEQFERHMRLIADEYNPVSADDVLNAILRGSKLPPRAVMVTVDDGYRDFKNNIWPIANRHGIRPVLFVPTAFVGAGVFWWDRLYDALQRTPFSQVDTPIGIVMLNTMQNRRLAFVQLAQYMKKEPFDAALAQMDGLCSEILSDPFLVNRVTLDWDELRELARAGVTVAPHTHTHPALGNIPLEQARFEIKESKRLVMQEIGSPGELFAYPYGSRNSIGVAAGEIVRDSGVRLAFTMEVGRVRLNDDDPMYLPRIDSNPQMTLAQFHAKLTPLFERAKK